MPKNGRGGDNMRTVGLKVTRKPEKPEKPGKQGKVEERAEEKK